VKVEVRLANCVIGGGAHVPRQRGIHGDEAAASVLGIDERGDQVDHRAQKRALVRQRGRKVLPAGILGLELRAQPERGGGFARLALRFVCHCLSPLSIPRHNGSTGAN
jgi:hypothetical protein